MAQAAIVHRIWGPQHSHAGLRRGWCWGPMPAVVIPGRDSGWGAPQEAWHLIMLPKAIPHTGARRPAASTQHPARPFPAWHVGETRSPPPPDAHFLKPGRAMALLHSDSTCLCHSSACPLHLFSTPSPSSSLHLQVIDRPHPRLLPSHSIPPPVALRHSCFCPVARSVSRSC